MPLCHWCPWRQQSLELLHVELLPHVHHCQAAAAPARAKGPTCIDDGVNESMDHNYKCDVNENMKCFNSLNAE